MKHILLILLFLIPALFATNVSAETRLTTCIRGSDHYDYTEGDQTIRKHGCVDDKAAIEACQRSQGPDSENLCDKYSKDLCRCAFDSLGKVTTPGGVNSSFQDVFGKIDPPLAITRIGRGAQGINNILNTFLTLIYSIAGILVLFMFVFAALQWILSGGDKEAVKSARQRITWAIIGITFLALTFIILRVLGLILGFKFFIS